MAILKLNSSDYVLGTHEAEVTRLELQHSLWRKHAHEAWRRAGIRPGKRVLDLGAGPGFATRDLARLVGASGRVLGVERSPRFIESARRWCQAEGVHHVEFHEADVMKDPLPEMLFDMAWCRWVACFVSSPERLVERLAGVLRPGGKAIFHEFAEYGTWRFLGNFPHLDAFVELVMKSWRSTGGEPNIARRLPGLLPESGFKVVHTKPYLFCIRPGEPMWRWPTSFIETNLRRLVELKMADERLAQEILREFRAASASPDTLMMTPVLLEVIAERLPRSGGQREPSNAQGTRPC